LIFGSTHRPENVLTQAGGVEDHGVPEALELGDQPAGVGVGVSLVEPGVPTSR
jgi:hypothetical protein